MDDLALQKLAEEHLDKCFDALHAWDDSDDCTSIPESPAVGPFCGCSTCVVREVLTVAYDELVRRAALAEDTP